MDREDFGYWCFNGMFEILERWRQSHSTKKILATSEGGQEIFNGEGQLIEKMVATGFLMEGWRAGFFMVKVDRRWVFQRWRAVDGKDFFLLVGHMDWVWIREEPPWMKVSWTLNIEGVHGWMLMVEGRKDETILIMVYVYFSQLLYFRMCYLC